LLATTAKDREAFGVTGAANKRRTLDNEFGGLAQRNDSEVVEGVRGSRAHKGAGGSRGGCSVSGDHYDSVHAIGAAGLGLVGVQDKLWHCHCSLEG
jgi:hypothetical protein